MRRFVFFGLLHCFVSFGQVDCNRHSIFCHIVEIKPSINKQYAMELSNSIYKATQKYSVPKRLFTAIIAQESMFRMGAKNTKTGLVPKDQLTIRYEFNKCVEMLSREECREVTQSTFGRYREETIILDVGLTQINFRTAERFELDLDLLLTDMDYSVNAGALVLGKMRQRWEKKEPIFWWSRYNASNPSKRKQYQQLVERWM